jgi:hypothetical protein
MVSTLYSAARLAKPVSALALLSRLLLRPQAH